MNKVRFLKKHGVKKCVREEKTIENRTVWKDNDKTRGGCRKKGYTEGKPGLLHQGTCLFM